MSPRPDGDSAARCLASTSGNCLMLTQGFGHCGDDVCDYATDPVPVAAQPCSCGDRTRPNVNHRKRIPCWTYLGRDRVDIDETGQVVR